MTTRASWAIVACAMSVACLANAAEPAARAPGLPPERPITADERAHWAYQPIVKAAPPDVDDARYGGNPIDRFARSAMQREGVTPLPRAGKATLIRRLYFDITGLPPTEPQMRAALADNRTDAYERLIDELLASPAYGERWAQHWLDLARFSETDGFEHDLVRPNAWRYRDWVIDALNADMPFDEFVELQVAGDLLRPGDAQAAVATGFLLCGPDMPDLNLQDERRHVVLNEMTATVGSVFLAMQLGCAACHDHKYDAIRQHDFYRMRAFFEGAEIFRDHAVATPAELAALREAEASRSPEDRQRDQRRAELEQAGRERFATKNPDVYPSLKQLLAELPEAEQKEHAALVKALRSAPKLPALSLGRVMREGPQRAGYFYHRGDFRQKLETIDAGVPRVLTGDLSMDSSTAPRLRLAQWLTSDKQPLVARTIANRLWQWHFGHGLAGNASDFGLMGSPPTNPQLLDWLADHLVTSGWSLKHMHRLLLTSELYRTASVPFDHEWNAEQSARAREVWQASAAVDPDNNLVWHRRRSRLEGEAIRDAMLVASGRLSRGRGGPGVRPPLPDEVTATLLKDQWQVTGSDEDHRRRSIYLFARRNLRYPMFDVFDSPDPNASCARRHESTTSTQSLVLFNSQFSLRAAREMARQIMDSAGPDAAGSVESAYLRALGRLPSADETAQALEFFAQQRGRLASDQQVGADLQVLADFCLALLNANEFVYLD